MTGTNPELRVDPLSGMKVLLAPGRSKRPLDLRQTEIEGDSAEDCPFCEGNEKRTPLEVTANRPPGEGANTPGWSTRVVPNKYPLLEGKDTIDRATDHSGLDLLEARDAEGSHELIVHTPEHKLSMADLTGEEMQASLYMWSQRIEAHSEAAYVHLFVNEGAEAGASRAHTHAQLLAMPFVPPGVARERERFSAYFAQHGGSCLLCDLVQEEIRVKERVVAVDEETVMLAPYASMLPYQLQIVPRQHHMYFGDDGDLGTEMLMRGLELLSKQLGGTPPMNMWVRTAPSSADHFHWHIEIVPRLTVLAGVELGVDVAVNTVSPEFVATSLGR